jgi:radical SAM-linked protein
LVKNTGNSESLPESDVNVKKAPGSEEKRGCQDVSNNSVNQNFHEVNKNNVKKTNDPPVYRILFSYCKHGSAVYHGHLSLIEIFSMSFRRAGIPVLFTQGFNPLVKMEFASPLSTGISADNEIASVNFLTEYPAQLFIGGLNKSLPEGIRIISADSFYIGTGVKKRSLASLLWGYAYINKEGRLDFVNAKDEKVYRQNRLDNDCKSKIDLIRAGVLANNISDSSMEWLSYFDAYRFLYPKS